MMSAWNLIWIVPAAAFFGFMVCAILSMNDREG
jgi:hypothetical protein